MKGWTFAALAAATLVLAPPARASTTAISGTPLTVDVGERGQLQAVRTGEEDGIFYPNFSPTGDAGFFLAFPGMMGQNGTLAGHVYGFTGWAGPAGLSLYTPLTQGAATGSGTAAAPFTQETTYGVSTVATIKQTTTYVNGAQSFRVRWDVTNDSGQPLPFKALVAADFFFEGSDVGVGSFSFGPPRFVGGTNADTGRSGGFIESTPWDAWQALDYDHIWSQVVEDAANTTAPSFDRTIQSQATDNAGGVEWDDTLSTPLASHGTRTYELLVRSAVPAALQFDRMTASAPKGTALTFVATATDTSGQPYTGRALRYTIAGANPGAGAVTIDANGNAAITDPGANAGSDTIVTYVDLNGNGSRERTEPQATVTALLAAAVDHTPPACSLSIGAGRPAATKPLLASVTCNKPANLVTAATFTVTLPKKKGRKARTVTAKAARTATQVLLPGKAVPLAIKVPTAFAKKYANAKVTATVHVTAVDVAGNSATKSASRTLRLAALKKKHRR
jgi:hypothetical protein